MSEARDDINNRYSWIIPQRVRDSRYFPTRGLYIDDQLSMIGLARSMMLTDDVRIFSSVRVHR